MLPTFTYDVSLLRSASSFNNLVIGVFAYYFMFVMILLLLDINNCLSVCLFVCLFVQGNTTLEEETG